MDPIGGQRASGETTASNSEDGQYARESRDAHRHGHGRDSRTSSRRRAGYGYESRRALRAQQRVKNAQNDKQRCRIWCPQGLPPAESQPLRLRADRGRQGALPGCARGAGEAPPARPLPRHHVRREGLRVPAQHRPLPRAPLLAGRRGDIRHQDDANVPQQGVGPRAAREAQGEGPAHRPADRGLGVHGHRDRVNP